MLFFTFSVLLILKSTGALDSKTCIEPCTCCSIDKCNSQNECDGCKKGFSGLQCTEPCHSNCEDCSQMNYKTCISCKTGYYNGRYNDSEDHPFQEECGLMCKHECKTCVSFNKCVECKDGLYLNSVSTCEKCPVNCNTCSTGENCLTCNEGYFLDGSNCQYCGPNCNCCKSKEKCIICSDGFFPVNGQCIRCLANCRSCNLTDDSQYQCFDCDAGYYLQNYLCHHCDGQNQSCLNGVCSGENDTNQWIQANQTNVNRNLLVFGAFAVVNIAISSTTVIITLCFKKRKWRQRNATEYKHEQETSGENTKMLESDVQSTTSGPYADSNVSRQGKQSAETISIVNEVKLSDRKKSAMLRKGMFLT